MCMYNLIHIKTLRALQTVTVANRVMADESYIGHQLQGHRSN